MSHYNSKSNMLDSIFPALQEIAGWIVGSRCVEMTKLPEGLYDKVFCLNMENGRVVLARIPNPDAGHPQLVVASEVAAFDFVTEWAETYGEFETLRASLAGKGGWVAHGEYDEAMRR
ncbi:hypothetical protein BJX65DRAFT_306269 [Aspergillus insuetus]